LAYEYPDNDFATTFVTVKSPTVNIFQPLLSRCAFSLKGLYTH